MRTEQTTAARSLRAVALVVTLVTIVTFSTVAYSIYQDVNGIIRLREGKTAGGPGSVQARINGNTAQVEANFTIPNGGLYPIRISIACAPTAGVQVSCRGSNATIAPGQTERVTLLVTVANLTQFRGGTRHLPANISVTLEPFGTLAFGFDLGPALSGGGS